MCLELLLGAIPFAAFAQSLNCPTGHVEDTTLNRCVIKKEVVDINTATKSCEALASAEAKSACYQENANSELADMKNSGQVDDKDSFFKDEEGSAKGVVKAANAAVIAVPLLLLTNNLFTIGRINKARTAKGLSKFKCSPASLVLMYSGAGVLATGEVVSYFGHKSRLKKLDKAKQAVLNDSSTAKGSEMQSESFELLAQNEESIGDVSATKKGFYAAGAGLFAASTAMAVVEKFQLSALRAKQVKLNTDIKIAQQVMAGLPSPATQAKLIDLQAQRKLTVTKISKISCDVSELQGMEQQLSNENTAIETANSKIAQIEKDKISKQQYDEEIARKKLDEGLKQAAKESQEIEKQFENLHSNPAPVKIPAPAPAPATTPPPQKPQTSLPSKTALDLVIAMSEVDNIEILNYLESPSFVKERNQLRSIPISEEIFADVMGYLVSNVYAQDKIDYEVNLKEVQITGKAPPPRVIPKVSLTGPTPTATIKLPVQKSIAPSIQSVVHDAGKNKSGFAETVKTYQDKAVKLIGDPVKRAVLSGVFGTWVGVMAVHYKKQEKISKERADKLRSMKQEFNSTAGLMTCTPAQRLEPTVPRCYCFTEDNKLDPKKSTFQVCSNVLATIAAAKAYSPSDMNGTQKVCVTIDDQVDDNCACKSTNTCQKVSANVSGMGFSTGMIKTLGANMAPANDLNNGVASAGQINVESALKNAAALRKAAEDIDKKMNPGDASKSKKAEENLSSSLISSAGGLQSLGNGSGAIPSTPAGALAELTKEIEDQTADNVQVTSQGTQGGGAAPEPALEFGMTEDEALARDEDVAAVLSSDMDMGDVGVHKADPGTNLFKVLSNRYKSSGYKRLFKIEGINAPAKEEVSEP